MTVQVNRLADGGLIDRGQPLDFTFDGKAYQGYRGDTLASALIANGVRTVGRSFKYHRRRGIFAAGAEEPNALVQLGEGARSEPNMRATQVELHHGLDARSQNRWPSLDFDVNALGGLIGGFLPSGFYYKTFMWPRSWWPHYERILRSAAGLGKAPAEADPDRYQHRYAHCDVLVAGGGPAGLAAALAAARSGARVIVADESPRLGGNLLAEPMRVIDGVNAGGWVADTLAALEAMEEVQVLPRTTVFGYYDHNLIGLSERLSDHLEDPDPRLPRHRLWKVRAARVVLATGAIERPIVFDDNDLPGIMLASAARTYVNRYGVRPGKRSVVFTNNDSVYGAVIDMAEAGIDVSAVIDVRPEGGGDLAAHTRRLGIPVFDGHAVSAARGGRGLEGVEVVRLDGGGPGRRLPCDLLCVSGGWNPTVHLFSQSRGRLRYDAGIAAFVPDESVQAERSAGAANGAFTLAECLEEGLEAGTEAARAAGFDAPAVAPPRCDNEPQSRPIRAFWESPAGGGRRGKRFVDLQNDVTAGDVELAVREGYRSVEHLKRYTTLGMGTDQGRTANVNGLALLAERLGKDIDKVGTTTFRPPYVAVTLGAVAGHRVGAAYAPVRRSAIQRWHQAHGAVFGPAGAWLRPKAYPRPGEDVEAASLREARQVRTAAGLVDVSTLGKIDIQGRDAAAFLERIYINGFAKLAVGRCRYGVMLREDGLVFDDGVCARIAEDRYLMTTTTVHAAAVLRHLEYYSQVVWPELDLHLVSVTEQWAAMALAGPHSRLVLAGATEADLANRALPYMGYAEAVIAGVPARLFRISFSGELAYEINVPADHGAAVWEALIESGDVFGLAPYGTEAMSILRIEKGHVVGAEINGRASADDLGLGGLLGGDKDFVGKRSLDKPVHHQAGREQLVGLAPADGSRAIPRGARIVEDPERPAPNPILGQVTSSCFSPNLGHPIALALVADGRRRLGQTLWAASPLTGEAVRVTLREPVFIDPHGKRLRG